MTTSPIPGRIAVILFNLGGPDQPEAIRPFLFNLFYDPAIIRLPNPLRFLVAYLIAARRAKTARVIYDELGGRSPLLDNTKAQATALEAVLNADEAIGEARVFIAMRYWHPMSFETARAVKDYDPAIVVLLPLYPQFSTTTTASSWLAWRHAATAVGLKVPTRSVCCYPDEPGLIAAIAANVRKAYGEAAAHGRPRLLFSAHGLPERVVQNGDPYQWQCERTAEAIGQALAIPDLDAVACYQSRVGPLKWIGPSTEEEIRRAGRDRVPVVVTPVAFVSEHSETLVEIEIEYRKLAQEAGVPFFARVPTVEAAPVFIDGLAALVRRCAAGDRRPCSSSGNRLCPKGLSGCPRRDT